MKNVKIIFAFCDSEIMIFTTSKIRIIPVGVFNGRRSQCNGTPQATDGI